MNYIDQTKLKGFATCTCKANIDNYGADKYFMLTDKSQEYLIDFLDYCKSNNINNIVFARYPHGREIKNVDDNNKLKCLINKYGYEYLDLNSCYNGDILSLKDDFYDQDHLNIYGTEKFTHILCDMIEENYLYDTFHSESLTDEWNKNTSKTLKLLDNVKEETDKNTNKRFFEIYHRFW